MRFLILLGAAVSRIAFANIINDDLICQQISEMFPEAIWFSDDEKIYLRPETIQVTERGLFVRSVPVPALFSDELGCWMQRPRKYWICVNPNCANYRGVYSNSSGKCPACNLLGDPG